MNGGYDLEGVIWHQHSNKLMKEILKWFDKEMPVLDLGCGHNFYVSVLNYAGYQAMGIDLVNLGSKYFYNCDITEPLRPQCNTKAGTVMFNPKDTWNIISLEVGEHIPAKKANAYLDNLTSFGGNILMSWAVPGQAGVGHINCQSNSWVIEQMKKRGYEMDFSITHDLRQAVVGCHCTWFQNTLMYFTPKK